MLLVPSDLARVRGFYRVVCRKRGGEIRWKSRLRNGVTYQGLDHLLDRGFRGIAAVTWYAGMIGTGGFTGLLPEDTALSHAGWIEYAGILIRKPLSWGAASGGNISSGGAISLSVTGAGQVRGCLMASESAVGSTAGVLFSTAELDDDYDVGVGDTIFLIYAAQMG